MTEQMLEAVFCTKYWESSGIITVQGYEEGGRFFRTDDARLPSLGKNDWYRDLDEAHQDVASRRDKKVKSLREKIQRLESLDL